RRKASRPPRCSTERRACAVTRRRTDWPSASERRVTLTRFGRNRVFVLRFEWLTRLPTRTAFPVSSQRRDIAVLHIQELRGERAGSEKQKQYRPREPGRSKVALYSRQPPFASSEASQKLSPGCNGCPDLIPALSTERAVWRIVNA